MPKVTRPEMVTRTYCDVCGDDITNATQHEIGPKDAEQELVTCGGTLYEVDLGCSKKLRLKCYELAQLWYVHPELKPAPRAVPPIPHHLIPVA